MIHCIGDSHTTLFMKPGDVNPRLWSEYEADFLTRKQDVYEQFAAYPIGPATAYGLWKRVGTINTILGRFYNKSDYVMLVVGEIDCRAHVVKQSMIQSKPIESVSFAVADKLFEFLLSLREEGIEPIAWNALYSYRSSFGCVLDHNPEFLAVGTPLQRGLAVDAYNQRLSERCKQHGIPFIGIWKNCDLDYRDAVHLSSKMLPLVVLEFQKCGLLQYESESSR